MAIWTRVQGLIFGTALGAASADAVAPQIEPARQHAWSRNRHRVVDAGIAARLVAQAGATIGEAEEAAGRNGFGPNQVAALVYLAMTAPPVEEAQRLRRRNKITRAQLLHSFEKAQIEPQYWDALADLVDERLDPSVIANAIVRGIMSAPFKLPVPPPSAVGKVKAFPISPLDTEAEAAASGINLDRLFVETAIAGRPMSPEAAAAAVFKAILDRVDFDRAISEGDVRNEWAEAIFENSRPIVHPLDYVQAHLRGWRSLDEMHKGAQRSGMRDADTDLLFLIHGRPPSWHQIWIGLQRGGTYDGPIDMIDPAFLKGLRESDLRPEWYNLLWHSRYNYPSAFVLRALTQAHDITQAESEDILKFEGWEPTLAATVSAKWYGGTGAKADPNVKKAQTQLWTTAHRSYVADESDTTAATGALTALGVAPAAIPDVLALWDHEKALIRKQLTPAQVKKAFRGAILNRDTGAIWTRDDALAALLERGYSANAANEFLDL